MEYDCSVSAFPGRLPFHVVSSTLSTALDPVTGMQSATDLRTLTRSRCSSGAAIPCYPCPSIHISQLPDYGAPATIAKVHRGQARQGMATELVVVIVVLTAPSMTYRLRLQVTRLRR